MKSPDEPCRPRGLESADEQRRARGLESVETTSVRATS
jgi:hypothetical protein